MRLLLIAFALLPCLPVSSLSAQPALVPVATEVIAKGTPMPRFKVDAAWPAMPDDLMVGQVSGVAVDGQDNVWIVHRPQSLKPTDTGLAQTPPAAVCCKPAPPVVKFAKDGTYLAGWGGPQSAPTVGGVNQWPKSLHGIFVDDAGTVWFGGNGDGDHVVLNYSGDGRFLRAFGAREQTAGNLDRDKLGNPSDINVSEGMVLISDGYTNKRVIGYETKTGGFKGLWGAYGTQPAAQVRDGIFDPTHAATDKDGPADPASKSFGDIVHCVVPTKDGHVYVCDRRNNRAQMFKRGKEGSLSFIKDLVVAPQTGGTRTVTDIALSPDQKYLYVADMMNGRIWILLGETHEVLGAIGRNGRYAGEFTWLHSIATDSEGNIYTTEVNTGQRVQKLVFTGVE